MGPAVTDQGTAAPAGADNKTGLNNMQPDAAGLRLRRGSSRQANRRKCRDGRHKLDQVDRPEHYHPPVSLNLPDVFAKVSAQVQQLTHLDGAILGQAALI
jgi:hypothetical protein